MDDTTIKSLKVGLKDDNFYICFKIEKYTSEQNVKFQSKLQRSIVKATNQEIALPWTAPTMMALWTN